MLGGLLGGVRSCGKSGREKSCSGIHSEWSSSSPLITAPWKKKGNKRESETRAGGIIFHEGRRGAKRHFAFVPLVPKSCKSAVFIKPRQVFGFEPPWQIWHLKQVAPPPFTLAKEERKVKKERAGSKTCEKRVLKVELTALLLTSFSLSLGFFARGGGRRKPLPRWKATK